MHIELVARIDPSKYFCGFGLIINTIKHWLNACIEVADVLNKISTLEECMCYYDTYHGKVL